MNYIYFDLIWFNWIKFCLIQVWVLHSSASFHYSSCFPAAADMLPLLRSSTSITSLSINYLVETSYTFCNDTHHHQHGQQYMLNRLRLLKIVNLECFRFQILQKENLNQNLDWAKNEFFPCLFTKIDHSRYQHSFYKKWKYGELQTYILLKNQEIWN